MGKILTFNVQQRLWAEFRAAIYSHNIPEITRIYYEIWPEEGTAATRETRGTPDLPHFAERAEDIPGFISAIWVSHDEWERLAKKDGLVPTADYAEWIGDSVLYFLRKRATARVSQPVAPPPPVKSPLCDNCGKPSREHYCYMWHALTFSPKIKELDRAAEPVAPGASATDEEVPQWAIEAASRVYWRTCSRCGDVDRSSLAKAIAHAVERRAAAPAGTQPAGKS
jgi:hypothetical protein